MVRHIAWFVPAVMMLTGCGHSYTPEQKRALARAAERLLDNAVIVVDRSDPTMAFAADELRSILEAATSMRVEEAPSADVPLGRKFTLAVDPSLPPSVFAVEARPLDVKLSGHGPSEVLCAVYTLLERTGVRFDVMGPILPDRLALDRLDTWETRIVPAVRRRGIRQHINFPMDLSSYPLAEAKEYIRNLARLRMNHITFHSYPTQWYTYRNAGGEVMAGNFFYGQRHDVPDHPAIKAVVRNRKIYCIPEIEAVFDDARARERAAKEWLREAIREAKRVGMSVAFSIEVRDKDVADGVSACRAVLETYPEIDALEVITQELGGSSGEDVAADRVRDLVAKHFGEEAVKDDGVAAAIGPGNRQCSTALEELFRNMEVVRRMKEEAKRPLSWAVGLYVAHPRTLKIALALMRKFAPSDTGFTFMTAYGGRPTVRTLKAMELSPDDWRRTMVHSWIEYDGNEYLQQNSVVGTKELIDLALGTLKNEQIAGIDFNHWRTAENRTAIRYAAVACIDGPVPPEEFYRDYAAALSIGDAAGYAKAMALLDDVDFRVRKELSGIGFCFSGSWVNRPGMAWIRHWKREDLQSVKGGYARVRGMLAGCRARTEGAAGRTYLRFLENRIECSEIHLEAVDHLLTLRSFCDDAAPEKLTEAQRGEVVERCRAAEACVNLYIRRHAEMIADRGCEGTLVSYNVVLPAFIAKIKTQFGAVGREAVPAKSGKDAPPDPGGGN